eukprot:scaffold3972_cov165-Cylindrotheca_fusiformis.AAC.1
MEVVIHTPSQRLRVSLQRCDAVPMKLYPGLTFGLETRALLARAQGLNSMVFVTMPQPFTKRKPFVKTLVGVCAQNRNLMTTAPEEVVANSISSLFGQVTKLRVSRHLCYQSRLLLPPTLIGPVVGKLKEVVIHIPNPRLHVRLQRSDAVPMKMYPGLTMRKETALVARAQGLNSM